MHDAPGRQPHSPVHRRIRALLTFEWVTLRAPARLALKPPKLSIARAIGGFQEWRPKARRVSSRMRGLTAIAPCGVPVTVSLSARRPFGCSLAATRSRMRPTVRRDTRIE